ncbi:hypothetical protein [Carboxylicivirga sp. N1Y90]|uniref:hypothetical protein n=1 Tax=Carboxylicivirga fragile TaxID=3417571 RepID=UPI003D34F8AC|nr:hypothetical protein [Marinilabiliaceae bacterium N1Y90]
MKVILLTLLLLSSYDNPLDSIRMAYHQLKSEEALEQFLESIDYIDNTQLVPYKASAIMQKAEYVSSPFSKLKFFNQGKHILEEYIKKNPNNIEARYVRIMVQSQLPGFLGYKNNMESDAAFIHTNIQSTNIPIDYSQLILINIDKYTKKVEP